VTVVLSGEGGDELFAGYPQYRDQSSSVVMMERFQRFLSRSHYFPDYREYLFESAPPSRTLRNFKYFQGTPALNSMLHYDMKTWMPDNLMMKADKILMAHSLEGRFPFLDRHLFDFASTLPEHYKWSVDGISKAVLKAAFRGKIPDLVTDRPKMGFSVPVADMLLTLKDRVLDSTRMAASSPLGEIINLKKVSKFFDQHYHGNNPAPLQVWTIFILLHWFSSTLPHYCNGSWRNTVVKAA
jgi:asparagine synthase (glutamine-hydrolysing)